MLVAYPDRAPLMATEVKSFITTLRVKQVSLHIILFIQLKVNLLLLDINNHNFNYNAVYYDFLLYNLNVIKFNYMLFY